MISTDPAAPIQKNNNAKGHIRYVNPLWRLIEMINPMQRSGIHGDVGSVWCDETASSSPAQLYSGRSSSSLWMVVQFPRGSAQFPGTKMLVVII